MTEKNIYKPQLKTATQQTIQKPKKDNAKRILVVGDFVASAVASELKKLSADNVNLIIIDNTVPASGLVRTDYYSWNDNIVHLIQKNNPDVIIIIIGANDNQPLTTSDEILNPSQPEWINIYKQRVIKMTENLDNSGKPWIWVGQPVFKSQNLTQKMKILNELYENVTKAARGRFVDIWRGFTDQQGQFSFSDDSANGKTIQLRTSDGTNFTSQGKRKLILYLEKPLETILNFDIFSHNNTSFTTLNISKSIQKQYSTKRQSPISLDEMAKQNTHLLYTIDQSLIPQPRNYKNNAPMNRADNFSLPQHF
ncbi:SGNH/GDSL hydrolase family protein [Bartonella sp. F02]|uniref:SGNH/GDSL hydrolase family protein n=1 Tax=Bartonella sp. F02 TaxID=2967262 RepID=UPI0022A93137|nr:SGNH family hydrolase [Bartonella sp. F02]MCZ2328407.1 DUF459 domain-containing protein [Bartonella sp. F02]